VTIKRRFSLPFWILLIILELVGAVIVVVDLGDYAYDDAYIYLNGARQLSRGELPDMTPGEELSTNSWASHLWLALITPAFWLGVDPLWWAKILGMLLLGGVIAQLAALLRRFLSGLPRWKTIAAAGVSLLFAPLILGALNALETLLCVFSLLWLLRWAVAYLEPDGDSVAQTRATLYLGLIAGLHLLTRPDAFVEVLFVLALTTLVTIRRRAAVSARFSRLALGLLPGTAIFVLVWVLYGSPLPTSAGVKILDFGRLAEPWFWRVMLERLGGEFVRTPGLLALYLGLFALLIRWSAKTESAPTAKKPPRPRVALAWLFGGLALLRLAEFTLNGDPLGVHRLWLPAAVTALAATLLMLFSDSEKHRKKDGESVSTTRTVSRPAVLLLLGLALFSGYHGWRPYIIQHYAEPHSPARQLGELINELSREDSWLLTPDMGVVPYYADIPTVDAHDQPKCNAYRSVHPADLEYVWRRELDFFILITAGPELNHDAPFQGITEEVSRDPRFTDYRHLATAQWRPASHILQSGGRYFHLMASPRVAETAPRTPPLLLRD
jgi:hypothetical protein